jgi:pilus assembly protein CpaE
VAILADEAETCLDTLTAIGKLPCALVCAGPASQSDWILRSMRLGALEYLPIDHEPEELATLVDRLARIPKAVPVPTRRERAPLVAVLGVKGGAGSTVVASQLAASLAHCGRRTAAVDLDLLGGSLAVHYDLQLRYSIADLARQDELDESFLRSVVGPHRSGVQVLAAPSDPMHAEYVAPRHVSTILDLLEANNDVVVADLAKRWDPIAMRALQAADLVVLVMSLDLPALAATVRTLTLLEGLEIPRERIRLVANRYDKGQKALERDAEAFLGGHVDFRIPNDYATVTSSITAGEAVSATAPHSPIAAAYRDLAIQVHAWLGIEAPRTNDDHAGAGFSRVKGWFTKGNA